MSRFAAAAMIVVGLALLSAGLAVIADPYLAAIVGGLMALIGFGSLVSEDGDS